MGTCNAGYSPSDSRADVITVYCTAGGATGALVPDGVCEENSCEALSTISGGQELDVGTACGDANTALTAGTTCDLECLSGQAVKAFTHVTCSKGLLEVCTSASCNDAT